MREERVNRDACYWVLRCDILLDNPNAIDNDLRLGHVERALDALKTFRGYGADSASLIKNGAARIVRRRLAKCYVGIEKRSKSLPQFVTQHPGAAKNQNSHLFSGLICDVFLGQLFIKP